MAYTITFAKATQVAGQYSRNGQTIGALIAYNGATVQTISRQDVILYEVVEEALNRVAFNCIVGGLTNEPVTVGALAGHVLPAGVQTRLKEQFELEPAIGTITFS
jgi:hypothetical protein